MGRDELFSPYLGFAILRLPVTPKLHYLIQPPEIRIHHFMMLGGHLGLNP